MPAYLYKLKYKGEILYYICDEKDDNKCLGLAIKNPELLSKTIPSGWKIVKCDDTPIVLKDTICTRVIEGVGTTTTTMPPATTQAVSTSSTSSTTSTTTLTQLPTWLSAIGYAYDEGNGSFSLFSSSSTSLTVMLEQTGANGVGWVTGTYYEMLSTSEYGYNKRKDFAPNLTTLTGILKSPLRVTVKNSSNITFSIVFTPENTPYGIPKNVPLTVAVTTTTVAPTTTTTIPPINPDIWQPLPSTTPPSTTEKMVYLESNEVKVGFRLQYGGSIVYYEDKINSPGVNMINNSDLGRQLQSTIFSGPNEGTGFSPAGFNKNTAEQWKNFSWNPIQSGDSFFTPANFISYGKDNATNSIYVKSEGMQWAIQNYTGVNATEKAYFEHWYRLVGRKLYVHFRATVQRQDQTVYASFKQEQPVLYMNTSFYKAVVHRGTPFTNETVSDQFTIPPNSVESGGIFHSASEYWMAMVNESGYGMGIYSPMHNNFMVMRSGNSTVGSETSGDTNVLSCLPSAHIFYNEVLDNDWVILCGSVNQMRQAVYSENRPKNTPNFRLNRNKFWTGYNALPVRYQDGYMEVRPTDLDQNLLFMSPSVYIDPSVFNVGTKKLYVRLWVSSDTTDMAFWAKKAPGLSWGTTPTALFSIPPAYKNNWYTYEIDLSNNPTWNVPVYGLAFGYGYSQNRSYNDRFRLAWISTQNVEPNDL